MRPTPTKLEQFAQNNPSLLAQIPAGQSLTDYVRHLYERSAAPVREIAALAGVSERTIYKYVQKGNWRRRHACPARDAAVAAANSGRTQAPRAGFCSVKGAGGRFIPRADKNKPRPHGLKALDPAGAARAVKACKRARAISDAAMAQAKAAAEIRAAREQAMAELEQRVRTLSYLTRALREFAAIEAGRKSAAKARPQKHERAARDADERRHALARQIDAVVAREKERREQGA